MARVLVLMLFCCIAATHLPGASYFGPADEGWKQYPETGKKIGKIWLQGFEDFAVGHYYLAVPTDYTPHRPHPVVFVLHGGPGRADEHIRTWANRLRERGAIAVFPQCIIDNDSQVLRWNRPQCGVYLLRILRDVSKHYNIDTRRVSLLGHSMGGGGAWALGGAMDEFWSCVSPHAGWYTNLTAGAVPASALSDMPVFLAHGTADSSVPINKGADGVWDALQATGNEHIRYERLVGDEHSEIYNKYRDRDESWLDDCADWCLSHSLDAEPTQADAVNQVLTYSADYYNKEYQYIRTPIGTPINYAPAGVAAHYPTWTEDAAASSTEVEVGEGVTFTADGDDQDSTEGLIDQPVFILWQWQLDSDDTVSGSFWGRSVVHRFPQSGTYTVLAIPMDDSGNMAVRRDANGTPIAWDAQALSITVGEPDDTPVVSVEASDAVAAEGGDSGTFRFTRSGDTSMALPVVVSLGGSVTLKNDVPSGVRSNLTGLSFAVGEDTVDVEVTPTDDSDAESIEVFGVDIMPGQGYILGEQRSAGIRFTDNDVTSGLPLVSVVAIEPDITEWTTPGILRLTRQGSTVGDLTVTIDTGGDATQGVDYRLDDTYVIPDGQAAIDIEIPALFDNTSEGDESLVVLLDLEEDDEEDPDYRIGDVTYTAFTIHDHATIGALRRVRLRVSAGGNGLAVETRMVPDAGDATAGDDDTLTFPDYPAVGTVAITILAAIAGAS